MSFKHTLLALLVVVIWGCNFIFIKLSVNEIPPLFLCALRFFMASVPAIFFFKPPKAPVKLILAYGLLMFGLQFALLFMGMKAGMTPGLASIIGQVQIFFCIFFAALILDEVPTLTQLIGAAVSFSGIALVGFHLGGAVTLSGFLLIIAASIAWGLGNLVTKKISNVNMMALVVWGSFIACFPLSLCSFIFEGPHTILQSFNNVTWVGVGSLLYIVYISTWIGYGVWNKLVSIYPIPIVVPFTLLVPVVGLVSSAWMMGESLPLWKIVSGLLVIAGLCVNIFSARIIIKPVVSQ